MSSAACTTPERDRSACAAPGGRWAGVAATIANLWRHGRAAIGANPIELLLRHNRTLRLSHACGSRIVCTAGCVWITAHGLRDDIFLHAGDAWEIGTAGLVLFEAAGDATVAIGAAGAQTISPST